MRTEHIIPKPVTGVTRLLFAICQRLRFPCYLFKPPFEILIAAPKIIK